MMKKDWNELLLMHFRRYIGCDVYLYLVKNLCSACVCGTDFVNPVHWFLYRGGSIIEQLSCFVIVICGKLKEVCFRMNFSISVVSEGIL